MNRNVTLNVSELPRHAFGFRDPLWWGAVLLVAIEGTMMALLLVSYFYLRGNYQVWPPAGVGHRAFQLAVAQAGLLLASFIPNLLLQKAARGERLAPSRLALLTVTLLGVAMIVLRGFEFDHLVFRWDDHAYGSIFWMILVLHTTHVAASIVENGMLLALLFRGPVEKKNFSDLEASAVLWYLVVFEWVAAFAILYLEPIVLPR
jgi:cytochrome c oxidase subunit III